MSAKLGSHIDNLSQLRLMAIKPGDVFLGEMDGVDHEKFFIVAGVSGDRILCCSVLINSKINPFIMRRPHMLERQLCLRADEYDFLSHESYVNCAQPFKSRLDFFSDAGYKYKGCLSEIHIKQVQDFLITSGQLTQEEIDSYFPSVI